MKRFVQFLLNLIALKVPSESNDKFFGGVTTLFPKLSTKQKEGLEALLKATSSLPLGQRAYLLATAYHETGATMQPIHEYGGVRYFDKYDTGKLAKALGNTPEKDGDGYKYRGRGYVQLTGLTNYRRASKQLGANFVNSPDLALLPKHAADILVKGCVEGWFTGKKLNDYINDKTTDYRNARRVVNGVDDADLIASYARVFQQAL